VKSMLVASENRIKPPQNALTLSLFNLVVVTDAPSIMLDAMKIPREAKSTDFSILTKPLSKTVAGSRTSTRDNRKATRFNPAQKKRVVAESNMRVDKTKPKSKPISHPTSVKPS